MLCFSRGMLVLAECEGLPMGRASIGMPSLLSLMGSSTSATRTGNALSQLHRKPLLSAYWWQQNVLNLPAPLASGAGQAQHTGLLFMAQSCKHSHRRGTRAMKKSVAASFQVALEASLLGSP